MQRKSMSIADFEQNIKNGWMPVHSSFAEDDDSEPLPIVHVDMICEWRITDGKVYLVALPFENKEEFDSIARLLRMGADKLHAEILANIDELENNRK